jgi:uncharacterized RDD family membrane protein YckC
MKAWRLRIVDRSGGATSSYRPLILRYVLSSLAWGVAFLAGLWLREHPQSTWGWIGLVPLAASLGWTFVDQDRQALYDRAAGTRLVADPKTRSAAK